MGMLVLAVLMILAGLTFRVQLGPKMYRTALPGAVLVISSMPLLGIGTMLLLRSPFRMTLGERLFRLVWMGPIGLGVLRLAGARVNKPANRMTRSVTPAVATRASAPPPVPVPAKPSTQMEARVGAIEKRLADLERWRATH